MVQLRSVAAILGVASASRTYGRCPEFNPMNTFDMNRFFGKWYDIWTDWENPNVWGSQCATQQIWNPANPDRNSENQVEYTDRRSYYYLFGAYAYTGGLLDCPYKPDGTCKRNTYLNRYEDRKNYYVIDTDYDNWALVYDCNNIIGESKAENFWIMSRAPRLSDHHVEIARDALMKVSPNYDFDRYARAMDHPTNCDYQWNLEGSWWGEQLVESVFQTNNARAWTFNNFFFRNEKESN